MSCEILDKIQKACKVLSKEARELYLSDQIPEVENFISPLTFYREHVSKNLPLLVRGGARDWPATEKWGIPYFRKTLYEKMVTVAVTPNGYADAIATRKPDKATHSIDSDEYFVMPEERSLKMSEFLDELENPGENVFYIQRQNSNFKEDFPELLPDAEEDVSWATEAFGKQPDAVNIWMGDRRAVTSMHKDPYENIYCVISGEKEFILHPPTDLPWIPYGNYPPATYKEFEPGRWAIEPVHIETPKVLEPEVSENRDSAMKTVPWISVDPLNPDYKRYPRYRNARTMRVKVREGDVLYLPSLWFHHVTQSHACIALNYWYDMEYDIKYAYYKTLEVLCQ